MQLDIGMVFSSLIGLFLLMGVGWVSVKTKIVPPAASAPMSSLLLKVTLPCTIFSSLATREFDSAFLVDGVITSSSDWSSSPCTPPCPGASPRC